MIVYHLIPRVIKEGPVDALVNLLRNEQGDCNHVLVYKEYDLDYFLEICDVFSDVLRYRNLFHLCILLINGYYSILHTHTTRGIIYSLISRARRIHSCQIIMGTQAIKMNGPFKGHMVICLNKLSYYFQDSLICSSQSVLESLSDRNRKKATVIYNTVISEYSMKSSKDYYVIASRLSPEKNVREGIDFFIKSRLIHNSVLYILGNGPEMDILENDYKSELDVRFLGFLGNYEEVISQSKAVISCSTTEGLPITLLKALAHGKPLLLSDIGPHRELISNNGFLYTIGDLNSFHEGLTYIEENIEELGKNSRHLSEDKFAGKKAMENYINLLH